MKNAGAVLGPPIVRGVSDYRYSSASVAIGAAAYIDRIPHASKLVQIFWDGGPDHLPADKAPTTIDTDTFNCFGGTFSEWLTHNSGAVFSSVGEARIPLYEWDIDTSLATLVGTSYQIRKAAEDYYMGSVRPVVEEYFRSRLVGEIGVFPSINGEYDILHVNESSGWPYLSVTFDDPLSLNSWDDDVFTALARARLGYHKARFTVEKKRSFLGNEYLDVTQARYWGEVEDLYDFNLEGGGAGEEAAIIQIGHGIGSAHGGRDPGIIYRDRIIFDEIIDDPF